MEEENIIEEHLLKKDEAKEELKEDEIPEQVEIVVPIKKKRVLSEKQKEAFAKGREKAHARMKTIKTDKLELEELKKNNVVKEYLPEPLEQIPVVKPKKKTKIQLKKEELERLKTEQEEEEIEEQITLLKKKKKKPVEEKEEPEVAPIIEQKPKRNFIYR